ncbi:RluA family pseudouridine synthase [Bacillus sp. B1-b2]|uniref:RluA family pseudouridine synthase n=1 Tax=Bacillus sp. B1-b2 TaxID=2653201 RepID=UPI0012615B86|nr:RluA family pseudouridine synthase [Bacillus sp. B1-b2]KAB7666890.1 RluA family pseudouridine synthase [Bacillus sp. B1-b2]
MNFERKGDWLLLKIPTQWENKNIEEIFASYLCASRKQIHLFKMEKKVQLNNQNVPWTTTVHKGDSLKIKLFHSQPNTITPTYMDLSILYEDDFLLIVNKPDSMDTHPNDQVDTTSLLNGVAFYLLANGEERQLKHIHRLDRDTTGCILFAKHELVANMLDHMLRERDIKRTYIAVVHGLLSKKKGSIDKPIGKDRHHSNRRRIAENGQHAVTHYQLLKKYPNKNLSLLSCTLDTGRTHQIRVHLSSIKHPLAGDTLYGGTPIFTRQALHAVNIQFKHPFTEETLSIYAPPMDQPEIFPHEDWNHLLRG